MKGWATSCASKILPMLSTGVVQQRLEFYMTTNFSVSFKSPQFEGSRLSLIRLQKGHSYHHSQIFPFGVDSLWSFKVEKWFGNSFSWIAWQQNKSNLMILLGSWRSEKFHGHFFFFSFLNHIFFGSQSLQSNGKVTGQLSCSVFVWTSVMFRLTWAWDDNGNIFILEWSLMVWWSIKLGHTLLAPRSACYIVDNRGLALSACTFPTVHPVRV